MPKATSEYAAWHAVKIAARNIRDLGWTNPVLRTAHQEAVRLYALADRMMKQLDQGIHENPPLVVWANPPRGMRSNPLPGTNIRAEEKLSSRVYEVAYRHEEDGRDYKHKFSAGVDLYLATTNGKQLVVLSGSRGQKLWDDF